jgi:hypothetical protein
MISIFKNGSFTNEVRAVAGISLSATPLTFLIPLGCRVANMAVNMLLNPKANITVINALVIIGFSYLTYECMLFSRLIMMKAVSIFMGPNQYTPLSFHGYKFEWLQPEKKHPNPIIDAEVDPHGKVIVTYTYPASNIEQKLYQDIQSLKNQGHKI